MPRPRRRRARQRRALALGAAVLSVLAVALIVVFTTSGGSSNGPNRDGTGHTTTSTTAPPRIGTIGTYGVASTALGLVEPSSAPGGAGRSLPTGVWFPAGHRPPRGGFPLIVFSQGYNLAVSAYAGLIDQWVSAGYVVAAPTYPHTDPSEAADLDEYDIVNHPGDLRYVLTAVLDLSTQRDSALSGLIDPHEVAAIGHSDGGDVSLAVAANSCCRDPRVSAVVVLSGAELASLGGTYFSSSSAPLLAVQGDADTVNPPACSGQLFDAAKAPKYYLDLLGAGHEPPYTQPGTPDENLVATVTTDFLDAQLYGQNRALSAMLSAGAVAGVAQIVSGGSAPAAPGPCPGAPG